MNSKTGLSNNRIGREVRLRRRADDDAVVETSGERGMEVGEYGDLVLTADLFQQRCVGVAGGDLRTSCGAKAPEMTLANAATADDEDRGAHGVRLLPPPETRGNPVAPFF